MIINDAELRIAVPSKGRLMDQAINLLKKSGLKFQLSGRKLFATCPETGIQIILCNAQDIPALVGKGVVDMGITGSDLILEKNVDVIEHARLGFGKCRLAVAAHAESGIHCAADLAGRVVGTKFTGLAATYFEKNAVQDVTVLEIQGAVEIMVLLGLVDAIVDIVETGGTLREHDLEEIDTIMHAEAVLIGMRSPRSVELRDRLIRRIEGVLIAGRYSMLEYNCPAPAIDRAIRITPGYSSPTIQKTDSNDWLAVKVMVEKGRVQKIMDRLEVIGCRAIMETDIIHCRL